jgi:pimeloyl-ACP methyl ester carboxylesterase
LSLSLRRKFDLAPWKNVHEIAFDADEGAVNRNSHHKKKEDMAMANTSNTTAPTEFIQTNLEKYAYRRIGKGNDQPLLCLQHFTGTLDNWDPAVIDPLGLGREVILFESAGLGRSTGKVPDNMAEMAAHALAFVDALGLRRLDILGYSLGGMVAQQVALERPSLVHKMLLVATAPEGGEDIMHMDKPELRKITEDANMPGLEKLVKLFFAPSKSSQAAGEAFAARLALRKQDGEPLAGQDVAIAQITAFRAWEKYSGERFAMLGKITQPCLVVNGVFDNMIPVRNSYMLSEHLPNAMLLTYPDAGHGSLFQFYKSFVRQVSLFLDSEDIS